MVKAIHRQLSCKSSRFGAGCAEVIPKAYIGTSSGELQCKILIVF
ncbi:MAG: hypothetical protein ABFR02_02690 [Campylobacterota bacterium]